MAELLEDVVPSPLETKYAAMWKHQMLGGEDRKGCNERWIERITTEKIRLARSIRNDGFLAAEPPILVRDADGRLEFLDGTHRACCLLVLGEPVIAELWEPLPTFDPLVRYPKKQMTKTEKTVAHQR